MLEALLERAERDAETIELFGLRPLLERIDADSVAALVERGAVRDGIELVGTVPATPTSIDALLELFTDPLLRVAIVDASETPLFVREQPELNYWFLTDGEFDRLREAVDVELMESTDTAP
ncbi:hypothetical protein [Halostagnicola kamekurae]|uniref:Uncharacterized protein n=1 Tax=Halostagnicola kamekurae TaxID=619731 RepID=A0A1I6NX60_9EURY|nr:hypothetical protein [Halostagnicola kamekurae]SFS32557.1 hypothetical protein SAMN04488556_0176 [Halostagnicola kamekurae]